MFPCSPSLLTRLRRHRGLWMLAVAVMLIKLVTGTVCLTDGPAMKTVSAMATAGINAPAFNAAGTDVVDAAAGCALGEQGECHCACAHMATLPSAVTLSMARIDAKLDDLRIAPRSVPAVADALIRPPIS